MFQIFSVILIIGAAYIHAGNSGSRLTDFKSHSIEKQVNQGIDNSARIYEAICWYEFLKTYLPQTRSLDFNQCQGQGSFQRKMILKQGADEKYFGQFLLRFGMNKLPKEYSKCSNLLLEDRYKVPAKDYSEIFKQTEAQNETTYPYQAFANCMVSVLHQTYKDFGLRQLRERLSHHTHWSQAMFERENEFRSLHNSPLMIMNDELTQRAQKWADQLARDCQMYHIHSSHPDYFLNGSRMGENLFTGDGINNPKEDMALFGTNIWYEEIEHYPWPEYKGYGEEPFLKFSHFSQMIWKETKMVGYGYAINANENCGQYFIVARYFPPGNFWGSFKDNILPLELPSPKS